MHHLMEAKAKTTAIIDLSLSTNNLEDENLEACAFVEEVSRFWKESYGLACQVWR